MLDTNPWPSDEVRMASRASGLRMWPRFSDERSSQVPVCPSLGRYPEKINIARQERQVFEGGGFLAVASPLQIED